MSQFPYRKMPGTLILTWLIAGTMDFTGATIQYLSKGGKHPENIAKYIATAAYGKEKTEVIGLSMVAWGFIFHYLIALIFTIFFFWIFPKISAMRKNAVVTGLIYGAFVWCVMNLVVVPVSFARPFRFKPDQAGIAMGILMICIGLPISLMAKKNYLYKK